MMDRAKTAITAQMVIANCHCFYLLQLTECPSILKKFNKYVTPTMHEFKKKHYNLAQT
jgi:hypothetical protein